MVRDTQPVKLPGLSFNARKALSVHIGEEAGAEIASLIARMAAEIEELRRNKVDVTRIVPGEKTEETFG